MSPAGPPQNGAPQPPQQQPQPQQTDIGQGPGDVNAIPDVDTLGPPNRQNQFQLKWSDAEVDRIAARIQADYRNSMADHNRRIARWQEYFRRWLGSVDVPMQGEEESSNMPVPYIQWNVFTKWAKEMDSLFGDDAEIVAVPVGPSNYRKDKKISRYMTWRVFNSMQLLNPFCIFVLRKILFGRSIAYSPWQRDTFECENPSTGEVQEIVDYEGPGFEPMWPDDFIVPVEEVRTLHDFSYVIRRVRVTPDDLLKGEAEGKYQNITDNWEQIINLAKHGVQREIEGEEIKEEADEAEGLLYQRPLSSGEWIMVLEWYGKWRPLKKPKDDGDEWDFSRRQMRTEEFVVRFLFDLRLVIGVQSLQDLYPTLRHRRPFVESSMFQDGRYWCAGLPELLINLEDDLRANHNQATEAGQLAMNPPLGYRPASGMTAETIRVEPGLGIPMDDPSRDFRQLIINADMKIPTWKEQTVVGYGERLTGHSDLQLGRQEDRPNAPRTAKQTIALLEEGNVRISLDTKVLREDMAKVLRHFWELEYIFAPGEIFFRVTEEDAGGLFEVHNGGSMLTMEDRDGRYDFRLQFASSVYSREAKKEQALARYQIDLQNRLIVTNDRALWATTRDAHEALGDPNFAALVPEPPAPDISVDPKQEWVNLLHGDTVTVNPMDNDKLHLIRHYQDIVAAQSDPVHVAGEPLAKLVQHYQQHIAQLQQKKTTQAVMEGAANAVAQALQPGGAGPLAFPRGIFGPAGPAKPGFGVSTPGGNPQETGPFAFSGHPEIAHEQ